MQHSGAPETALTVAIIAVYGFAILLSIAAVVLLIVELVDCVRRKFRNPNDKLVWVLVIALGHGIGAIIYYYVGRPKGYLPGAGTPPPKPM